jgi:NADH dehydrogenase [ubiquinone] 1 alpha subcomplex assembly factor 7
MTPLAERLRRRIALAGPITVSEYMAEALGDPAHGYYATRDPFGRTGDFVTAPEISQMFGELIGLWCAGVWADAGRPAPVSLVELGPGRGTLMADALRAARAMPGFLEAVRVNLVEMSPVLRRSQEAMLSNAPLAAPPAWLDRLADLPPGPMLLIANEFFDALPVRQFQRTERGWRERLVDWNEEESRFRPAVSLQAEPSGWLVPPALADAPAGSVAEISPAGLSLAADIGARLKADGLAALIVDYGHVGPAAGETLQAVRRHRYADPLEAPGEADLTAHVDFAALSQAAREAGAEAYGPLAQGEFLRRLGIETRADRLASEATPEQAHEVASGLRRLTEPDQMGRLFKALALAPPGLRPPGF